MKPAFLRFALAAVSLLVLSACGANTVKDTLGLERAPPDEFRVVSRPPLSVPPQFSLRPPSNSDASPNQLSADKKAQGLLSGKGDANGSLTPDTAVMPVTTTASSGKHSAKAIARTDGADEQFLKNAGADHADPKVRDSLVEEKFVIQEQKEEKSWYNFWDGDDKKEPIVDSRKEADRIKKNEDEGKPVTNGATPDVKSDSTGILNDLLGK